MEVERKQIENLKANSFQGRYGKTGTDFKVYFDTLEELKSGIDAVILGAKHLKEKLELEVKEADAE